MNEPLFPETIKLMLEEELNEISGDGYRGSVKRIVTLIEMLVDARIELSKKALLSNT